MAIIARKPNPRHWIDAFVRSSRAGRIDPEAAAKVAEMLHTALGKIDAIDINEQGEKRYTQRAGQLLASSLGFTLSRGRPKSDFDTLDQMLESREIRAAVLFEKEKRRIGRSKALLLCARTVGKDARTIERYWKRHANTARNIIRFEDACNQWDKSLEKLRLLSDRVTRGEVDTTREQEEYALAGNILFLRPLTREQVKQLKQMDTQSRDLVWWWFSNAVYTRPRSRKPIGSHAMLGTAVASETVRFINSVIRLYQTRRLTTRN